MRTLTGCLHHQANAAFFYQRARLKYEPRAVRDSLKGPIRTYTLYEHRQYQVRMQNLAARHAAEARRLMGVES